VGQHGQHGQHSPVIASAVGKVELAVDGGFLA
jgi:hypothetical protein